MATETKTFYPGAHEDASGVYGSISNPGNPVGKGVSNTTYARIPSRGNTAAAYWPFDVSIVPVDATIDSVACKAKAKGPSSLGTNSNMQLYSGTTAKGSSVSAPSSAGTKDITAGAWTRPELSNIRLRTAVKGTSSSTSYFDFYGADLTVTYTYQSEKFMLKLGGSWTDVARVFKKVSGIWVEQTDLANVIEDGVRYQNGGYWESPYRTVTITGTGNEDRAAVIINGVTYTTAQSIQVEKGTVITLHNRLWSSSVQSSNRIVVDGVTVVSGGGDYNYTVNDNCTIALYDGTSGSYKYGIISVTTIPSGGSNLISFTIAGTSYQAQEGMTWGEWVASSYNTERFYVTSDLFGGYVYNKGGTLKVVNPNGFAADPDETIASGYAYTLG